VIEHRSDPRINRLTQAETIGLLLLLLGFKINELH
jgi:hypothetical protein